RLAAAAMPGGTGALRQAFELIRLANPDVKVWLPEPTWPNHPSILKYLGMTSTGYAYFDEGTRSVNFAGMLESLANVAAGDVVLLHGCCHNPTGANLTAQQWPQVIALLKARGAIPLVDIAYQGFGDGLDDDAAATRAVVAQMDECLVAASCSKNFGLYRERTGILMVLARNETEAKTTQGTLSYLNRQNFSFPPDHGARIVTEILTDPELRADWQSELEEVRLSMLDLRQNLADALRRLTNSDNFDFIAKHRGMFSRLGLSPEIVNQLRDDYGIYMVGDSRVNIAGLNAQSVPILAKAIVATMKV
ncbi:MAG: aspartate/tyrosine/aromatic aminotransferase, partial [Rhodobacteraceae bacterium]|nr:aspartate/tyrosine/aromatic aminotransferase [Paracoccaceae bacterium]